VTGQTFSLFSNYLFIPDKGAWPSLPWPSLRSAFDPDDRSSMSAGAPHRASFVTMQRSGWTQAGRPCLVRSSRQQARESRPGIVPGTRPLLWWQAAPGRIQQLSQEVGAEREQRQRVGMLVEEGGVERDLLVLPVPVQEVRPREPLAREPLARHLRLGQTGSLGQGSPLASGRPLSEVRICGQDLPPGLP